VATLQIIADHLANAIENARLYEKLQQEAIQLILVNQIAAEISSSLDLDKILQTLVDELARVLGVEQCAIAIFDEKGDHGDVVAEYLDDGCVPSKGIRIPLGDNPAIELVRETKKPLAVRDAQHDPYLEKVWGIMKQRRTQSIMLVPIIIRGEVVGTIGLDAVSAPRDFTTEEQWLAETIAHHTSIAIQNARQYEELKRTKGLVGARNALAWMGMTSAAWRHAIGNDATTIQDLVELAQRDLAAGAPADKIQGRLDGIDRMANKIRSTPITAPLHEEEGVRSVPINELVRERIKQLCGREPFKRVQVSFDARLGDSSTVRASSDWLRRAFDILIENAVEAMTDSDIRELAITTELAGGGVELSIADTGRGIPDEVHQRLFRSPIPRPKGSKGLGVGLLMAHAIVQTYGGDIRVGSTEPSGTTMIVWLPVESEVPQR
jgi:signal transduction histidine kinase